MNAGFLHFAGPSDIVGLIKAGFQFNQNGNLFFIMGGGNEGIEDGGIAAGAIEGHFYGEDLGIGGSLIEKRNNRLKTFVGVVEKDVVLANDFEAAGGSLEGGGEGGGGEWIVQVRETAARFR